MRLDVSQHLRLEQRMKLSPRMIQAMEILQLPMLALQERIEQELSSNPCLEVKDVAPEATGAAVAEPGPSRGDEPMVVKDDTSHQADFQRLDEYGETFSEDLEWSGRAGRRVSGEGERDAKMDAMANAPAHAETLADVLDEQWSFVEAQVSNRDASGLESLPEAVKAAGRVIISNLDDDGYLRTPLEELVSADEPLVTVPALQQALPMVQRLDPPGVAARDLRECLLIQLGAEEAAGQDVGLQKLLVNDFLHEIELNHIPQIARKTGKSVKQINDALAGLGRLDPRPGRMVGDRPTPYIIPDAIVELDEQGNLVVTMREGDLPALTLSRTYRKMADSRGTDDQAREFIRKNLRSAQWLMAAIMQRRQTVRRVVEEVFQAQKEFLERGAEALRPLPMTDVAAKVGVHVATVSRAVAGKYVQTPRGIFPLRMFFSGGKTTNEGQDVAWDAIRVKLRDIVDHEDKSKPLDDEKIAQTLSQASGITIARRTVAKYRNLLNIPPARQRREY